MKKILRRVALTATSLGLSVGWAGVAAADTASIANTGSGSQNVISCNVDETYTLDNNATVGADNFNGQLVVGNNTEVEDNRNVGGVGSGSTSASQATSASVSVNQSGSSAAALGAGGLGGGAGAGAAPINTSISGTGSGSENRVRYDISRDVSVSNNADVTVENTNVQGVFGGRTEVEDNRNVGSVTSGSTTATQTSSTSVSVSQ